MHITRDKQSRIHLGNCFHSSICSTTWEKCTKKLYFVQDYAMLRLWDFVHILYDMPKSTRKSHDQMRKRLWSFFDDMPEHPLIHFQWLSREWVTVSRQHFLCKGHWVCVYVFFCLSAAAAAVPGFNNFNSLSLIRLYDSLRDSNWSVSGRL